MIIQFSHNGQELNLSKRSKKNNGLSYIFNTANTGFRFWNNEPTHKRKFIKHQGWYLKNIGNSFDTKPKRRTCVFGESGNLNHDLS